MSELIAVGPDRAELFVEGSIERLAGLAPGTDHSVRDVRFRTLDDIGEILSSVVTMNDVHFGEIECGKIDGVSTAAFVVADGDRPYPEIMNESVIADARAADPDAVIVKGDLTSFGTLDEFEMFRSFYEPAFGERLTYVRGNHDSFPGQRFADWPVQVVDVSGLRVILIDTSRAAMTGGSVSGDQLGAVEEAARTSTTTVIVMGHHPLYVPGRDRELRFDGINIEDSLGLIGVLAGLENVVAYSAGHTHRCRKVDLGGLAVIEVACVKDFPGAWAEHLVGERGIAHLVHRASSPEAVAWAETTRSMFDGYYGTYAMGLLEDRCFVLPLERLAPVRLGA